MKELKTTSPLQLGHTDWRTFLAVLGIAIVFRYVCHSLMLIPVLFNELRPAPTLPDLLLANVPYVRWVARWNYWLWVACYVPPALYFLYRDHKLFGRFVILDGAVSLIRGLCIPLTGLGPPNGADMNALEPFSFWDTWMRVVNPVSALLGDSASVYLTKDMFFSGHIATTFLLFLCSRSLGRRIAAAVLMLHFFCLLVVLLSHLHYTIDIVGAYAIVFCIYTIGDKLLREKVAYFRFEKAKLQ